MCIMRLMKPTYDRPGVWEGGGNHPPRPTPWIRPWMRDDRNFDILVKAGILSEKIKTPTLDDSH